MHQIVSGVYERGPVEENRPEPAEPFLIDEGIDLISMLGDKLGMKKVIDFVSIKSVGNVEILRDWLFKRAVPRKEDWQKVLDVLSNIRTNPMTYDYIQRVDEKVLAKRAGSLEKPKKISKLEQKLQDRGVILPPQF